MGGGAREARRARVTHVYSGRRAAEGGASAIPSWRSRAARVIESHPYAYGVMLFAIGWAVLASPWLSGSVTIPYDAKAHFQAQIQFLANAISTGQSPFWNPNAFAGLPHVADPQSLIFSPAIVLAYFNPAPSFRVVDAYVLTLLAAGGLAVMLIFREMRWPVAGAVVAALAFAFGASAALRVQHVGQVQSLAFLMIAQWLLVRALRKARWQDGIFLGCGVALVLVEPNQVALLGAYMLALHALWHVLTNGDRHGQIRRLFAPMSIAGFVAVALAIIPLLLTYLFVETTTRAEISFEDAAQGSLHPASLLTALIADLFGAIDGRVEYWGPFSETWGGNNSALTQNMGHIYIGALPALAILGIGLFRGRAFDRDIRMYALSALLMLLYALGSHTPFFKLAYDFLPGVSGFRRPADATFLLGAYGAILAGYLVNQLLFAGDSVHQLTERRKITAIIACAAILLCAVALAWSAGKLQFALPKLGVAVLWCALAAALSAVVRWRGVAAGSASALALASLMVADLWANNGPNESTALPPAQFEVLRKDSTNPTICEVKKLLTVMEAPQRRDRIELVGVGFHWPNAGLVHRLENILGYNPLRLDNYSLATGARDQVAGWDQRNFSPLFPSYKSLLADMLGLRLIVSGVPIETIDNKLKPGDLHLVARTPDAFIYENPRALPRVMFTANWRLADFDDLIENGQWPQFDPRKTVLLDSEPNPKPGREPLKGTDSAQIVSYENTRIEIDVFATRPGFVVLNDIWHPWWAVSVDGAPGGILQANVLFRAVQVDPGRHRLVFEFNPVSGAIAELRERLFEADE